MPNRNWTFLLGVGVVCTLALGLMAGPATADDDEKHRAVTRIAIVCEDGECAESELHEDGGDGSGHHFSWFSGDGPGQFRLRAHLGGGYLGVLLTELTPELRSHFGVQEDAGVMISKVVDESPAARAGLQVGDIVTAIDGKPIGHGQELARSIRNREDGEAVLLEVWRDGSVQNLTASVEEREAKGFGMESAFVLHCDDDDDDDCSFAARHLENLGDWDGNFDCDGGPCAIKVQCDDNGNCECTKNGEEADCQGLPGWFKD